MNDRELMQQALDALDHGTHEDELVAIKDLRARLAQPEPKPVAWKFEFNNGTSTIVTDAHEASEIRRYLDGGEFETVLYTAPPRKEWQGLTDEEYTTIMQEADRDAAKTGSVFQNLRRAIEAKLKEKNT